MCAASLQFIIDGPLVSLPIADFTVTTPNHAWAGHWQNCGNFTVVNRSQP